MKCMVPILNLRNRFFGFLWQTVGLWVINAFSIIVSVCAVCFTFDVESFLSQVGCWLTPCAPCSLLSSSHSGRWAGQQAGSQHIHCKHWLYVHYCGMGKVRERKRRGEREREREKEKERENERELRLESAGDLCEHILDEQNSFFAFTF